MAAKKLKFTDLLIPSDETLEKVMKGGHEVCPDCSNSNEAEEHCGGWWHQQDHDEPDQTQGKMSDAHTQRQKVKNLIGNMCAPNQPKTNLTTEDDEPKAKWR